MKQKKRPKSVLVICKICNSDFIPSHFNQKLCSIKCKTESRRAVLKKHKMTDVWKVSNEKWVNSEKRKANERSLCQKPSYKAKAVIRSMTCLRKSPTLQKKKKLRDIEFSKSEKGKAINKVSRKKYSKTDKGLITSKNGKAKRRALEKNGKVTLTEWNAVLFKNDYRCVKCKTDKKIEMDHIIPLSKGGNHSKDNIQPLCRSCNASKGNKIWQN